MGLAKRKIGLPRTDSGRISRAAKHVLSAVAPALLAREREARLAELGNPNRGSKLGLMLLAGEITPTMYEAGRRWGNIASAYAVAISAKMVRAAGLEQGRGGAETDPDSQKGREEALKHIAAVKLFEAAHGALQAYGSHVCRDTRALIEDNQYLDWTSARNAKIGLELLVRHLKLAGK